jgi:nicotinate-nucleotide adenylyltransferase
LGNRVGIFGGSFDPVHSGHVEAVNSFISSGLLNEIWVMLTPDPPHKKGKSKAPYTDRLAMLKLAFEEMDSVVVSTYEKDLPAPSYTLQTLKHLGEQYPDNTFFLCLGGDSVSHFHEWYRFEEILDICSLIAVQRPGSDPEHADPRVLEKTIFVEHTPLDISSTGVRSANSAMGHHLPESVEHYINKHNLYS